LVCHSILPLRDNRSNEAASAEGKHSAESIFGGQSPLSTAPSSPTSERDKPLPTDGLNEMTDADLEPVIRGLLELTRSQQRLNGPDDELTSETALVANPSLGDTERVDDDDQSVPRFAQSSRPASLSQEAEESVADEPIVEESKVEQHVIEAPIKGALVVEQPVVEQPVVEQPVVEQPVVEQPVVEQPVVEQPVEEQPVEEQPVEEQPVEEQPVVENPVVEEPIEVKTPEEVAQAESRDEEPQPPSMPDLDTVMNDPPASPPKLEAQIDLPIQAQPAVPILGDEDISILFPDQPSAGSIDIPWMDLDPTLSLQDILEAESLSEPLTAAATSQPVDLAEPKESMQMLQPAQPTQSVHSVQVPPNQPDPRQTAISSSATASGLALPPQRASRPVTRLRKIAPALPEKLPEPILQPSENGVRARGTAAAPASVSFAWSSDTCTWTLLIYYSRCSGSAVPTWSRRLNARYRKLP
jgi:hypothetical protein